MADVIVLRGNQSADELRGSLVDSLGLTKEGVDTLEQMAVLFRSIIDKIESKPSSVSYAVSHDVLAIAKVGKYVAEETAGGLGSEHERISDHLGIPV